MMLVINLANGHVLIDFNVFSNKYTSINEFAETPVIVVWELLVKLKVNHQNFWRLIIYWQATGESVDNR